MFALHIASALDGFPVGDPGSGQHHIQTVAALQLGKRHIDLHIAHCRKEQLLGLGIVFKAQGFILVQQPVDALSDLVFLALVLGGDSHGVEGFRIFHAGIFHLARFRQGIARTGAHQFGNYADVAAGKSLNLGGLFTDNSGKVRHFFGNTAPIVLQGHAGGQFSRHHLEIGGSAELIHRSLKHKQFRGSFGTDGLLFLFPIHDHTLSSLGNRIGECICNDLHQSIHTPQFGGGARKYRND